MNNEVPINLLGKHINEIPNAYTSSEEKSPNGNIYMIDKLEQFLGKPYKTIFITTNEDDIVQSLTIYIDGIIDKSFYDILLKEYGKPNGIYKKGEVISQKKETVIDGFKVSSTNSILQDCTFEEHPSIIEWNKEEYDIEVIIGDKTDTFQKTRIIFGKGFLKKNQNK